jgi:hypothetical protein
MTPTFFRSGRSCYSERVAHTGSILWVGAVRDARIAGTDHPWSQDRLSALRTDALLVGDRVVSAHERSFIVESHLIADRTRRALHNAHRGFALKVDSFFTTPAEIGDFSTQQVHVVERVNGGVCPLAQLPRVYESGTTGRLNWGCDSEWPHVSGHLWRDESCVRNVL